ncbi:MAG TPA: hypothetical protein VGF37_10980 [Chthoniobacterales bacterium]
MTIETTFNGLGIVARKFVPPLRSADTIDQCPNFDGSKGRGGMGTEGTGAVPSRELGRRWKVSPSINIPARGTATLVWTGAQQATRI